MQESLVCQSTTMIIPPRRVWRSHGAQVLHHGQKFQADEGVRTLLQGRSHAPMFSVEERRKAVGIDVGGKYPGTNIGRRIIFLSWILYFTSRQGKVTTVCCAFVQRRCCFFSELCGIGCVYTVVENLCSWGWLEVSWVVQVQECLEKGGKAEPRSDFIERTALEHR